MSNKSWASSFFNRRFRCLQSGQRKQFNYPDEWRDAPRSVPNGLNSNHRAKICHTVKFFLTSKSSAGAIVDAFRKSSPPASHSASRIKRLRCGKAANVKEMVVQPFQLFVSTRSRAEGGERDLPFGDRQSPIASAAARSQVYTYEKRIL